MFEYINGLVRSLLQPMQLVEREAAIYAEGASFLSLFILAVLVYYIARFVIRQTVFVFIHRSSTEYDDILIKNKVFSRASYLVPSYIISTFVPAALPSFPKSIIFVQHGVQVYVIFVVMLILSGLLSSVLDIYNTFDVARSKPIKGLIQIIKIIMYVVGGLMIVATVIGRDLGTLLLGLGTLSAVLILVFKDPILGFVGGIQLSQNDMVRLGDWITMNKYGADGEVKEITLTTVKVQNWDKTITTIPTYAMVSDYFQNWRGMQESGVRRIKRHLSIDMESVKFCTPEMLQRFRSYQLISAYIDQKEHEISQYNAENNIDTSNLVNGRRQTNLGVFRAYMTAFFQQSPRINKELTLMVRQLQPTEKGIPIEIYVFSKIQEWTAYEALQSDIFDHMLAVLPMFDLRVFQEPSNSNLSALVEKLSK
ncbi:MAG: mechanosensitive ion channel family protein [Bacteroidetes bacterium]|nr:mechanosensitive ion channel family protein [Bacteroidales bacterium]MBU1011205.1 mechanosensitive ion channel family protein [Bacteroidota bacterium]